MAHDASYTGQKFEVVGNRFVRPDGVDKVCGRARYGADASAPGQLVGLVLRSPHAHAKIKKIDTAKAQRLSGVKAVITSDDVVELPSEWVPAGELQLNFHDLQRNIMAKGKVLYDGLAVAAVAASSDQQATVAFAAVAADRQRLAAVAFAADQRRLHEN